ncbi:hypothetical protein [Paenisporosarcina sp. OV554]|uniref:hypothetical protein n=1 Tax=Paenisporosarcina sp. OV554 TaxID=2135694 RepID=UPI001E370B38|nr:hypothetical protein [Paenisporosarcina sp. OV554]
MVNDGSGKEFAPFFEAIDKIPEVKVLHHPTNQGKGRALKTERSMGSHSRICNRHNL